jgi:dipeptidyl aminopeptidase/acylaminoacyl peptidase
MRRLLIFSALLFLVPAARSAAPPPVGYEKWTADDVVNQEWASAFRFSPDGRFVLWVRHSPDKEKNEQVEQVFRADLRTGRVVQLTRCAEGASSPRWSPDSSHIAYLSSRPLPKGKTDEEKPKSDDESKAQLWLLDTAGGEPWHLTEFPRGINAFAWGGSDSIVFAAQEEAGRRETVLKEKKDATVVVEDERHEPPVRLFRVDTKTRKVTRISDNRDRIEALALSPDGRRAVTRHSRSLRYIYDNRIKPIFFLYDLDTGKREQVLRDPKLNVQAVVWSPDGKGFYATNERTSRPELAQTGVIELYYHALAAGKEVAVDLDWPRGLHWQVDNEDVPGVAPLKDGFLAMLADGTRVRLARYTMENGHLVRAWLTGEHADRLIGLGASADGKQVAYACSTASLPPQWYRARLDGGRLVAPAPLGRLNEFLDKRRCARTEVVRWKGANGDMVEGLLYYPHGWTAGKRAPLLVQIHGGPAAVDLDVWEDRWSYATNLYCQRGAFVLKPNYHGSAAYGQAWLESNAHGKYCDLEVQDIEKGVDALIERGLADPKRLALQGWSNGAILTNILITRTNRYRAAAAGAGSVEYISDWASCEFGDAFDRFYLGKTPMQDPQLYIRKSPFWGFDRVKTPTLIFFGTEDRVVHPQQGWAQYRALQQLGKAPVRFVLFPGEKHGLKKLAHQRRKVQEELAWFDRYLFANARGPDDALKEDSPLAWLLKRQAAKTVNGKYGLAVKGALVPETVPYSGLQVGRFEVTRAQFAAFDATYPVESGKENYPAGDITFARAKGYCVWLTKLTGRRYRLPAEADAEELYGKPEAGENTLDAWAGYAVNPEDARALRQKLASLPAGALLREVGKGRGAGKEQLVFDLGGNVAEWVEEKSGKGALRGGSADQPADTKGQSGEAAPAYRGFRVVRD